nr:hypothetical protein [Tanacetum cinerariifolium]
RLVPIRLIDQTDGVLPASIQSKRNLHGFLDVIGFSSTHEVEFDMKVQVLYDCSMELCIVDVDLKHQQQIQRKT